MEVEDPEELAVSYKFFAIQICYNLYKYLAKFCL